MGPGLMVSKNNKGGYMYITRLQGTGDTGTCIYMPIAMT